MLGIVKDHVDGLVLKDDFLEGNDILVRDLPIQLGRGLDREVVQDGEEH